MRISEVAERSGFSSATLRYCEQVDRLRDLIMVKLGGAREQVVGLEVFTADLRRMLDNLDSELPGRVGEWRQLATHVVARSPIDGGTRLLLDAGAPLDELVLPIAAEQGCCSFFAFALIVDARGVALEVRASAEGRDLVDALFADTDERSAP